MKLFFLGCALLISTPLTAQTLAARLDALKPGQWLDYRVEMQTGQRPPCCFEWQRGEVGATGCHLQEQVSGFGHLGDATPTKAGSGLRVLLRRAEVGSDRILAVGEQCPVERGDAEVVSLGRIENSLSVAWLADSVERAGKADRSQALHALALHRGEAADQALERMASSGHEDVRRDASFWLAQARGERGFARVRAMIDGETNAELRGHLVFALSVSEAAGAGEALRTLVTNHADSLVRAEAMFWLAQKADERLEQIVAHALDAEDSLEVKRKAVFALSQLPSERALPALRALLESTASRAIRKEALFWLAQADDETAQSVLDDLLSVDASKK